MSTKLLKTSECAKLVGVKLYNYYKQFSHHPKHPKPLDPTAGVMRYREVEIYKFFGLTLPKK